MLIALATQSVWDRDILDAIQLASDAGYDGVEIVVSSHLPLEELSRRRKEIEEKTQTLDVQVVALAATTNMTGQQRLEDVKMVGKIAEAARELGTKIVKMPSGAPSSTKATTEDWKECADSLKRAAELAEASGVRLAMETHLDMLSDTTAGALRLIEAVNHPALGVTLDFCNVYAGGDDPVESIGRLKEHIVFAHVKDGLRHANGEVRWTPVGKGGIDYRAIIRELNEIGYDGVLSVEVLLSHPAYRRFPNDELDTPEAIIANDQRVLREILV